jgi:hypothetical protein
MSHRRVGLLFPGLASLLWFRACGCGLAGESTLLQHFLTLQGTACPGDYRQPFRLDRQAGDLANSVSALFDPANRCQHFKEVVRAATEMPFSQSLQAPSARSCNVVCKL